MSTGTMVGVNLSLLLYLVVCHSIVSSFLIKNKTFQVRHLEPALNNQDLHPQIASFIDRKAALGKTETVIFSLQDRL